MKKDLLSILTVFLVAGVCENVVASVTGQSVISGVATNEKIGNIRVPFVMNKGQENKDVSFYAKTFGGTVFVTKQGEIVYSMPLLEGKKSIKGLALKESLVGARVGKVKGEEQSTTKVSYFQGKDSLKSANSIQTYNSVSLGEIYDGIELKLKTSGNNVEKLFYVSEKAKPDSIIMKIDGAKGMKIAENGELVLDTALGDVKFTKPIAYQVINGEKVTVPVSYRTLQTAQTTVAYGFNVGDYNKAYPLIIDPLLASTFVGGSSYEWPNTLILDSSNNVYTAGYAYSANYPTTVGAYDTSFNGNWDIFISKLDSNLTTLISSTFIGGANEDRVGAIATDTSGNVYITGYTLSADYPITAGAYDTSFNGNYDAFITKLDGNLTTLLASTFIGGSTHELANALAIDPLGNIFIAGYTNSVDFPATTGAYNQSFGGQYDVFVSKLNSNLSTLTASTYIGGVDSWEKATAIAIDSSSSILISGYTSYAGYPTTPGAYDTSYNSGHDVFISKLDNNLTSLISSTLIGGSGNEVASSSLVLDATGNVYITGYTDTADYPTTAGTYDQAFSGQYDVFISKLDNSLSHLLGSTFIGGSGAEFDPSLTIDSTGNVYVAGATNSSNFPTKSRSYDRTYNGVMDVFISKLNSDLTSLLSSTYIGGSDYDHADGIAVNSSGNVYIAGSTMSFNYPTTSGSFDTSFNGDHDVFISLIDSNLSR